MELSPTRRWSVERHIKRKHIGIGEPVNINTHQTRTQMNTGSRWSNFSTIANPTQFNRKTNSIQRDSSHHYYNNYLNNDNNTSEPTQTYPKNNNTFSTAANNFNNEETRRGFLSPHIKKGGIIDDEILEMLRQAAEIKKIFRSNQLSYGLSTTPIEDISKQFIGTQLPSESNAIYLIHKNIAENSRNIGLRDRLCYNCCSHWIDLVHNNKEEGMKLLLLQKLPRHE